MIKLIKTFLYRILSLNTYLKCIHLSFFIMFDLGMLRKDPIYKYHYFVKHLINEGDCIIDIGANLGYYSKIFYRLVGKFGKVISFEPMPPFFNILKWALRSKENVTLYNYALGQENKETTIFQPHPKSGYFRTGLSNIPTDGIDVNQGIPYKIEMRKGSEILMPLTKIDYIKIDIEGYEEFVLPELAETIDKHKPILQIETWGSHKEVVVALMKSLDYIQYSLYKNKLEKEFDNNIEPGDYLFIHKTKEQDIITKLKQINCA